MSIEGDIAVLMRQRDDARDRVRSLVAELVHLREAARDCAVSSDNSDTCGVCGKHFSECEAERMERDDQGVFACSGARLRAAMESSR